MWPPVLGNHAGLPLQELNTRAPFRVRYRTAMIITLNGQKKDVPAGLTVKALLEHLEITPERVAVEINEEIVRKATYSDHPVNEGDRVEVVQFMGGG